MIAAEVGFPYDRQLQKGTIKMHKKANGLLTAVAAGALTLSFTQSAEAVVVRSADFDFRSGAEFTGQILFSDDYSTVVGVNGTLTGYQDGIFGYTGVGSTLINWIWANGADFNPAANQMATFLMNGVAGSNYSNWISFAYDLSNVPDIVLAAGGLGYGFVINVNYRDPLVSGALSGVPEVAVPPSLLLMLSGLAGIATLGRSRRRPV
jgi:hypothetical protein